jgi:hypothetical protein
MTNYKFSSKVDNLHKIFNNAHKTPGIRVALEKYGYNTAKFNEGKALLKALADAIDDHARKYNRFHEVVKQFKNAWKKADDVFNGYMKIAHLIWDSGANLFPALSTASDRRNYSDWNRHTTDFYYTVMKEPAWLAEFSRFNITKEKLKAGWALQQKVGDLAGDRIRYKAEAKSATAKKDNALKEAHKWCSAMREVAKIALGKDSALLTGLSG